MAGAAPGARVRPRPGSPIAGAGKTSATPTGVSTDYEQLPEEGDDQDRAARAWLRHVEAGRIG